MCDIEEGQTEYARCGNCKYLHKSEDYNSTNADRCTCEESIFRQSWRNRHWGCDKWIAREG